MGLHAVARTGARIAFHRSLVRAGVEQYELIVAVLIGFHRFDGLPITIRILLAEGDFHSFDMLLTVTDERVLILIPPDGTTDATGHYLRHVRPRLVARRFVGSVGIIVAAKPQRVLVVFHIVGRVERDGAVHRRIGQFIVGRDDSAGQSDGGDVLLVRIRQLVPCLPLVVSRIIRLLSGGG